MNRGFLQGGAVLAGTAVALGAFGAHGLTRFLASVSDGAQRLAWWETAVLYHLTHALALLVLSAVPIEHRLLKAARVMFVAGIALFSGSLYAMTLSGVRGLGAVTPLGGTLLLAGWACAALGIRRGSAPETGGGRQL